METTAATLKRTDIATVSSTNRGCLRLLPQTKKASKQKLVVGDMGGGLSCWSVGKALEVKPEYSVPKMGRGVSCLTLHEDQVFCATGASVFALSKKGKQFFEMQTNMTEDIRLLSVRSPFLYLGGGYTITAFQESTEKGFYMAPDKVNDTDIDAVLDEAPSSAGAFLGCQDRMLRRLHHGAVTASVSCEAPVSAVFSERQQQPQQKQQAQQVVYGTLGGTISCVTKQAAEKLENRWTYMPAERAAAVSCVGECYFTKSGVPDVTVAREDGLVDVMQVLPASASSSNSGSGGGSGGGSGSDVTLQRAFTMSMGEFVSGLDNGHFTTGESEDIVISTFSGKVVALGAPGETDLVVPATTGSAAPAAVATPAASKAAAAAVSEEGILPHAQQLKIEETVKEITTLQTRLNDIKIQLSKAQTQQQQQLAARQKSAAAAAASAAPPLPGNALNTVCKVDGATAAFAVNDRFFLDDATGDLVVTTELDVPLGALCVSADVPLRLSERSDPCSVCDAAAVLPADVASDARANSHAKFLGVFRAGNADSSGMPKRLDMRFKVDEGAAGTVHTTIHTLDQSHGATARSYNVPPLSRHVRLAPADVPQEDLTENAQFASLYVTGAFSLREAHHWLSTCLMELPERLSGEQPSATYYFKNMYLGSILRVTAAKGEIIAHSQNAMTLTVLRDHVTTHATHRKIAVRIDAGMKPEAVDVVIWLGIEVWRALGAVMQQHELVDALKELESQEGDLASFLAPNLRDILGRAKELQAEAKTHDQTLGELKEYLVRWLRDAVVFAGSPRASALDDVTRAFKQLLDAPVNPDSETDLRIFCRDTCFPPAAPQHLQQQQQHYQHQEQEQGQAEVQGDVFTM